MLILKVSVPSFDEKSLDIVLVIVAVPEIILNDPFKVPSTKSDVEIPEEPEIV